VKLFRLFAVASAVLAFVIAVLGSWVRINDAGLTCPDWPLCHGQLVPSLAGGVVLEWSHRLVAFALGFVVLGAIITGFRMRSRIAGVTPALIALAVIFLIQVSLGGATVLLANSPFSVMLHWAMGMALLATLSVLAVLAIGGPAANAAPLSWRILRDGPAPALALAVVFAFATMCVGAYVSSSYAGLACRTFPACDGTVWGSGPSQLVQMTHRVAAGSFAIVAVLATFVALQTGSRRVRAFSLLGITLLLVQILLGAGNVVWHLPIALREAHAANAGATFLAFVIAATLAVLEPYRSNARERVVASPHMARSA
jgi:cytochrome c oxidase assembly protein subunit 15